MDLLVVTMRRGVLAGALLAMVAVAALAYAPAASAQGYSIHADCTRSDGWTASGDANYGAYRTCEGGWLAGLRTLVAPHSDGRYADGTAAYTFAAPSGTKIVGLQWAGNKYHGVSSAAWIGGGWAFRTGMFGDGFRAIDGEADCYTHNLGACYSGASSNPNARSVPSHYVGNLNESAVGFYTKCVPSPNNCPAHSDGLAGHNFTRAALAVSNMRVDLRDDVNPTVGGVAYVTSSTAGWHKGNVLIRFDARDNSGIERTAVRASGKEIVSVSRSCDWWRLKPCNEYVGADGGHTIDTTKLADGSHTLTGVAWDAAGRGVVGPASTIQVDNTPPAKPPTISVDGGSGWSPATARTVRWTMPNQGAGSPIQRFHTRKCKVGGTCTDSTSSSATATSWSGAGPHAGPGEYTVRIAVGDAAGQGAWSDPVTYRFDDQAPGAAEGTRSNGWLNAVERAAYQQHVKMRDDAFRPVSGIAGYSMTANGSDPDSTVEAPGTVVDYPINNLPEGVNAVRARAVSGAGVGSGFVDSIEVKVDLSEPTASVDGAPDPAKWQARPVSVVLTGTDQEQLSGMDPGDPARAIETGAYVAYRVDGGALQKVRGASAPVTVTDEGEHTITYYAVDVAGNQSETQTVQFKIDRTAPTAGATSDAIDPAVWQRESVTMTLTGDDGQGRSGMDPAPDDLPLEGGGYLVYRLNATAVRRSRGPSATFRVEDDGDHTVAYYAVDGAGNESEHREVRFRIDKTAPSRVMFEPQGADKRRLEVDATDATSGIGEVQIGLRRVGGVLDAAALKRLARKHPARYRSRKLSRTRRVGNRLRDCRRKRATARRRCLAQRRRQLTRRRIAPLGDGWTMLPATREGDKWVAYVPDDRSLRMGTYQLRAVAQDRAGNETAGDNFRGGEPGVIVIAPPPHGGQPDCCQPPGPGDPGYGGGGQGGGAGSGGRGVGPGAAPSALGPDHGTIVTKTSAGGVRKMRIKVKVPKQCRRPKTRAQRKRCARARRPRYRHVFVDRVAVRFGQRANLKGTVTTEAGAPVAGGAVEVIATPNAAGYQPQVVGTVTTDASGAFAYTAPAGPSRKVTFRFRGLGGYRRSEATAAVLVPGSATLKSSKRQVANGDSVVFTGRLLGKPLPERGKVIDLQAFYRGKWRTFATPRAGRSGRFKFRYRFEATRSTTTYRFRARLRAESAYPYELGYSKVVSVRVRGR